MDEFEIIVDVFGREEKRVLAKRGDRVIDVLRRIGVNPVEVVTVLDGEVVPEEEPLRGPSRLKLLSVVSGG